jgi:polyisoprenoid-binding protein YceI
MKSIATKTILLVIAALLSLSAAAGTPGVFEIDGAHSSVTFKIRHLISKVTGGFNDFTGTVKGNPEDPTKASVEFTIQAASIDTRNADRDAHLRNADFFDVEKFPEITFVSTKIVSAGEDLYKIYGKFTMLGVTKEIILPVTLNGTVTDPWGNLRAGFEITFQINRKDYGMIWNKGLDQGGMILGDEVEIFIALEAIKKTPEKK